MARKKKLKTKIKQAIAPWLEEHQTIKSFLEKIKKSRSVRKRKRRARKKKMGGVKECVWFELKPISFCDTWQILIKDAEGNNIAEKSVSLLDIAIEPEKSKVYIGASGDCHIKLAGIGQYHGVVAYSNVTNSLLFKNLVEETQKAYIPVADGTVIPIGDYTATFRKL